LRITESEDRTIVDEMGAEEIATDSNCAATVTNKRQEKIQADNERDLLLKVSCELFSLFLYLLNL
jgi:hypothetical protein